MLGICTIITPPPPNNLFISILFAYVANYFIGWCLSVVYLMGVFVNFWGYFVHSQSLKRVDDFDFSLYGVCVYVYMLLYLRESLSTCCYYSLYKQNRIYTWYWLSLSFSFVKCLILKTVYCQTDFAIYLLKVPVLCALLLFHSFTFGCLLSWTLYYCLCFPRDFTVTASNALLSTTLSLSLLPFFPSFPHSLYCPLVLSLFLQLSLAYLFHQSISPSPFALYIPTPLAGNLTLISFNVNS